MRLNLLVENPSNLGSYDSLVLQIVGEDVGAIRESGHLHDSIDLDALENLLEKAYETGELKKDKLTTFVFNNVLGTPGIPKRVGVVSVPSKESDTRKEMLDANKATASLVKEFAKKGDVALLIYTLFNVEGTQPPSVARILTNDVFSIKPGKEEAKVGFIDGIGCYPSAADKFDIAIKNALDLTMTLVTGTPEKVTPDALVEEARAIAKSSKAIKFVPHDPHAENMAGLLAVARGSSLPAQFIELSYSGNSSKVVDFVFIGKGITFDSGGYSLKPAKSMEDMKGDMAGAASVLGLFHWLSKNNVDLNIVGLIPTCENMIGKDAIVPGEVIHYSNGKTVEVLNTDAEGRLILADALIYSHKFPEAKVIDIATLTGGIVVGLGKYRTGLFTDNEQLKFDIIQAGDESADPVWHMPMDDESYDPKSKVADIPNITSGPSSITAAMFLKAFAPATWAHLDIAGTSGDSVGTGRPVPLMIKMVLNEAQ